MTPGSCSSASSSRRWSRAARLLPYLVLLVGFALRLYRINYQSIWWDEARSIQVAQEGFGAVWGLPGSVTWNHPPLHFALLTGWTRLTGSSELAVRYLSLLLGLLLIPLAWGVGRRLFGWPAGLVGAALATLAPLYVAYSQEARAYAVLPVFYLLLVCVLHRLALEDDRPPFRWWVLLAVSEALLIYSHYVTALGLIYANLFLLAAWLWRQRFSLRAWVASQALALALFAPWLLNAVAHAERIRSRLSSRDFLAVRPSVAAFARRIGGFLATGNLAAVEGTDWLSVGVTILGVTFALGLALTSLTGKRSRRIWLVLAHSAGPLGLSFLLWQVWPQAQPRYTLAFSAPLLLVMGQVVVTLLKGQGWSRLVGGLLAGSLALTFSAGLYVLYFDETYHKDDARGVAAYLEEVTSEDDVVLVSPNDYSVPYYYDGPAAVKMARGGGLAAKAQQLARLTQGRRRFVLVRWKPSNADLHGLRPFLLERAGRLESWRDFRGLDVRIYALDGPTGDLPELAEAGVRFDPLLLTGLWYEPGAYTDGAVSVALRWELLEPVSVSYKAVVMLTDEEGNRLSSADVLLLDESGRPTQRWEPGEQAINFYVVPVPVGTPPLPASLVVGVYDADTLERLPLLDRSGQAGGLDEAVVGRVTLAPGTHFESDPYGTWAGVQWERPAQAEVAPGLRLEQFAVAPPEALPGEKMTVFLRWRADGPAREAVAPTLRLSEGERTLVELDSPLLAGLYPPDRWGKGEVVVERREFVYPPIREVTELSLTTDGRTVRLAQMQLDEAALVWEWDPPPMGRRVGVQVGDFAELAGYDLKRARLPAGEPFELTLYWRALNDAPLQTRYTVFTQLLAADGHLIAQHDGPPVGNSRPTTSWVSGEIIADRHTLTFSDPDYSGPATLIVGLYDAQTITRLVTSQGRDYVTLPSRIVVRAPGR